MEDPVLRKVLDPLHRRQKSDCPRWLSVPGILCRIRADIGSGGDGGELKLEDARGTGGLLVLDDLGSEKLSEWASEILFNVVGTRYDAGRPTSRRRT